MDEGEKDAVYSRLNDLEKTAILLNILGDTTCKLLFSHMSDLVVRKVVLQMSKTTKTPHWIANRIMKEYYSLLNEEEYLIFTDNFINRSIGLDAANKLFEIGRQ